MSRFLSRSSLATALALAVTAFPAIASAQDARYIVKFNAGRSNAGRAAVGAAGGRIVLSLDREDAVAARIPERALAGLSRNPNIEYIEVDQIRTPFATWSDRAVGGEVVPYGMQMVQADLVTSTNEASKKVCIIDSGYSQQHIDLRDDTDASITQNAFNGGSGTWDQDSCGHGSHVAGTVMAIAGNGSGVIGAVPGVRLHVVKVFGNDDLDGGSCTWTYSSTLVNALNNCEAAGANIVSMSLGGSFKSHTEEVAFNNSYNRGMLHIAAAGNDGTTRTSYPAGYGSVMSVAAVDWNETVADFSQKNRDVEVAAPGVGVLSTVPWIDTNTLTFADLAVAGAHVEFSARSTGVTGSAVDGGLCDSVGEWSGKIVLCQRGNVSFNVKVQNVQSGGGAAAVIYNTLASDPTCADIAATLGDGNSSSIPAIGVSCQDGVNALARAGQDGTLVSFINTPASGYEAWSGTSMATPHVSGVAGLVWSCFPGATNKAIRNALDATARDKGTAGPDNAYGYGIVQAKAAVESLGASPFCSTSNTSKY